MPKPESALDRDIRRGEEARMLICELIQASDAVDKAFGNGPPADYLLAEDKLKAVFAKAREWRKECK